MNENAKKIIEEQTLKLLEDSNILDNEHRDALDGKLKEIDAFYQIPASPDKDIRETQYGEYRELLTSYGKLFSATLYNLTLTRREYIYLKNLILKKITYKRQELFLGLLVRDEFFRVVDAEKSAVKTNLAFTGGKETFKLDITSITRISHLTTFHEINGLDEDAEVFAEILKKIGNISKIYEVYSGKGDDASAEGGNWINGFNIYESDDLTEKPVLSEEPVDAVA